jgi:hypothetical protein
MSGRCLFGIWCKSLGQTLYQCKNCKRLFHHLCAHQINGCDEPNECGCFEEPPPSPTQSLSHTGTAQREHTASMSSSLIPNAPQRSLSQQIQVASSTQTQAQTPTPMPTQTIAPNVSQQQSQDLPPSSFARLVQVMNLQKERLERIPTSGRLDMSSENEIPQGRIFAEIAGTRDCVLLTNFTGPEVISLCRQLEGTWNSKIHRGPKPSLSLGDHLVFYLAWLKAGNHIQYLSVMLKVKPATGQSAIERIREVIHDALKRKWSESRPRPKPLSGTILPHAALLIDSTTIQINTPLGDFEEKKVFWDGKNHIYGIKKEVAVQASTPHFALFTSSGAPGSRHDYETLKRGFEKYIPYLRKTAQEATAIANDADRSWSAIFDNGYQGPDSDTPGLRRIFIPRLTHVPSEQQYREQLSRLRVPVEQFFGRLNTLWGVARGKYQWSHRFFDIDIDNCIYLTNEHISKCQLTEVDAEFQSAFIGNRALEAEQSAEQRRQKQRQYSARKKARLSAILDEHDSSN